jgi:hypothetical protein
VEGGDSAGHVARGAAGACVLGAIEGLFVGDYVRGISKGDGYFFKMVFRLTSLRRRFLHPTLRLVEGAPT